MGNQTTVREEKYFLELNNRLKDLGTTYFSILLFNSNNEMIYSRSSNPEWVDEFSSSGKYKKCHLLAAANDLSSLRDGSFTLAWDLYLPETDDAKMLDEIRKSKDITHGVGFCIKNSNKSTMMLNIAGKYADVNFGLNVMKRRALVYKNIHEFIRHNP